MGSGVVFSTVLHSGKALLASLTIDMSEKCFSDLVDRL